MAGGALQDRVAAIAQRATPLAQRLQRQGTSGQPVTPEAHKLLATWEAAVAGGEPIRFDRRLAWQGLSRERALHALSAAPGEPPAWASSLLAVAEACIRAAPGVAAAAAEPATPQAPLPFEHLLRAVAAAGRDRLAAAPAAAGLTDAARGDLERALQQRLAAVLARPLLAAFDSFRPAAERLPALVEGVQPPFTRVWYARFVAAQAADGLLGLFEAYPVAARLVCTVLDQWTQAGEELLARLAHDRAALAEFLGGSPLPPVVRIEAGLSDPHRGGRTVAVLHFADGRRVVYKPRSVGLEAAYARVIAWCNAQGLPLALRAAQVLERGDYGWMEHVAAGDCSDATAVERHHERTGMLAALLHAIGASDCHRENLIAAGEHPVLVDAETFVQPDGPQAAAADEDPALPRLTRSVGRTGLLPRWQLRADAEQPHDIGGLAAPQAASVPTVQWIALNTDAMQLAERVATAPAASNVPRLQGRPMPASGHVTQVLRGFDAMYRLLAARRDALLAPHGPLRGVQALPVRFVFRPTAVYAAALRRCTAPDALRDGARQGILLDVLARPFLASPQCPAEWPVLVAEQQALEQLDVPCFSVTAGARALVVDSDCTVPDYFASSGLAALQRVAGTLDEGDLAVQRAIVLGSLLAAAGSAPQARAAAGVPATGQAALEEEAARLARAVAAGALAIGDRGSFWVGLRRFDVAQQLGFDLLGANLYEGSTGIALFLAAYADASGDAAARALALDALRPVRQALRHDPAGVARAIGLGGGRGLGSVLFALGECGRLLRDRALLADAMSGVGAFTPAAIACDRQYDVMHGAAGAALGLLALARRAPHHEDAAAALAAARACGEHLLVHRLPAGGWRTTAAVPLSGYSHGSAGIAAALARLGAATGDARFGDAALVAAQHENRLHDPQVGNWRDLRGAASEEDARPARFQCAWCHGAPGIGLGRLAMVQAGLQQQPVRQDLDAALAHTLAQPPAESDHLCCGEGGRIALLLSAGTGLGRADLRAAALDRTGRMLARARAAGGYQLFRGLGPAAVHPGFFQGSAGIGHLLLRAADPERHADVLGFE